MSAFNKENIKRCRVLLALVKRRITSHRFTNKTFSTQSPRRGGLSLRPFRVLFSGAFPRYVYTSAANTFTLISPERVWPGRSGPVRFGISSEQTPEESNGANDHVAGVQRSGSGDCVSRGLGSTPVHLPNHMHRLSIGRAGSRPIGCCFQGLASSMHSSGRLAKLGLSTLATYLDANPLLRMSVYDFLWGYDDPFVALASKIFPRWINFPKIGVLDRVSQS